MVAIKKVTTDTDAVLMEQAFKAAEAAEVEVKEEVVITATDKIKVLNTSSKNVCLTSGILQPGDIGTATRAELGTLWQYLETAEK